MSKVFFRKIELVWVLTPSHLLERLRKRWSKRRKVTNQPLEILIGLKQSELARKSWKPGTCSCMQDRDCERKLVMKLRESSCLSASEGEPMRTKNIMANWLMEIQDKDQEVKGKVWIGDIDLRILPYTTVLPFLVLTSTVTSCWIINLLVRRWA